VRLASCRQKFCLFLSCGLVPRKHAFVYEFGMELSLTIGNPHPGLITAIHQPRPSSVSDRGSQNHGR